MIDVKHLKTLQALSEAGSLTLAADRLHVTQSALSHQLLDLERYFGVSLFLRKSRPLRLTPAGELLLSLAERVMPEIREAEQRLFQLGNGKRGRLHMAIECHSCYLWLIPAINAYRGAWPDVELDFVGHWHLDALPALREEQLDLVVTSDPLPLEGIHYEPLFRYEMQLGVALEHPLAREAFITPKALAGETLITYPVAPERLDVIRHFLAPAGLQPAEVRTADMTLMIAQLVASQRGVAALPSWALREFTESQLLCARPFADGGLWSDLYAAVRLEERDAPFMRAFLQTLVEVSFRTLRNIFPLPAGKDSFAGNGRGVPQ